MCFGVHIKQESFQLLPKNDPRCLDMCECDNEEIEPLPYEDDYKNLELLNWKKEKCYQCNRLYCAVILLSLLTNGKVFIKNLGHILGKIHRPSIENGKVIDDILANPQLEYLEHFENGSTFYTQESLFCFNGRVQPKKHGINVATSLIIYDRKSKFIEIDSSILLI